MLNKTFFLGRLTSNPEVSCAENKIPFCRFRLAVDQNYVTDGERGVDFISCVAWRHKATFVAKHFAKGQLAVVEGHIRSNSWTDDEGRKHYEMENVVDNMYFAGANLSQKAADVSSPPSMPSNDFSPLEDEDAQLPF